MANNALADRDQFEHWLAFLDEMIEEFLSLVSQTFRAQLDFSPASLDALEAIILEKYPDTRSMLDAKESRFVNGLACYIGETFRKKIGGRWSIRFDDPKFAFHGLPILVGAGRNGATVECPLTLVTAVANRRTGKYLRSVLEANM